MHIHGVTNQFIFKVRTQRKSNQNSQLKYKFVLYIPNFFSNLVPNVGITPQLSVQVSIDSLCKILKYVKYKSFPFSYKSFQTSSTSQIMIVTNLSIFLDVEYLTVFTILCVLLELFPIPFHVCYSFPKFPFPSNYLNRREIHIPFCSP